VDSELEVIRDQMHQTRASLADKLDALESQVRETVQSTTDAVAGTAETVKEAVEGVSDTVKSTVSGVTETVQSVAEKLDITQYVERAPWLSFGAAVAVGFAGGYLLGGPSRAEGVAAEGVTAQPEESFLGSLVPDGLQEGMRTALTGVRGLAVGALMGLVREMVTTSLPAPMHHEVTRLVDQVTTSLGGKPMDFGQQSEAAPARQEGIHGERSGQEETPPSPAQASPPDRRPERRKAGNGSR
jgi:ElaB/YqjD/DUF883 family membrane-anchored ribosome-binding protein